MFEMEVRRCITPLLYGDLVDKGVDLIHIRLDLIHKRVDIIQNCLDLTHTRLDLILLNDS